MSAQNRKRLYWTNIPVVELPSDNHIFLKDVIDENFLDYKIPHNWNKRVPNDLPKFVDPYNKKEIKDKSTALRTNVNNGNMWIKVQGGYRNLSRNEAEALQNVPMNYTNVISETQAKKCLGNGWTVDVIAHIFSFIA